MPRFAVDVWTVFGWTSIDVIAETENQVLEQVYENQTQPKLDPPPSTSGLTAVQFSKRVRICGQYRFPLDPKELMRNTTA
jgi:hypothetical protein